MKDDVGEKLSLRIRQLRLANNLTQEQLAERAEIDASVLSRIERGYRTNIRLSTLDKIIRALNVDYATMFAFTDSDDTAQRIAGKLTTIKDEETLQTLENLIDLLIAAKH